MNKQVINPLEQTEFTVCQKCKCNLVGAKIAKYESQFHGSNTHYSRLIPVRDDPDYPGITGWKCPDCGHAFSIFDATSS